MHESIRGTMSSGKALRISAGIPSTPGDPPVFNLPLCNYVMRQRFEQGSSILCPFRAYS